MRATGEGGGGANGSAQADVSTAYARAPAACGARWALLPPAGRDGRSCCLRGAMGGG
jgi:hypothetical protein